jgi:hypothetical protein
MPQPAGASNQAALAPKLQLTNLVGASGLSALAPTINLGAHATWQYGGVQYYATSNQAINFVRLFLPAIMRSQP